MSVYGVRLHDRDTEDDLQLGTVMYSTDGEHGPWHDMATGHPEWCWEILEALVIAEKHRNG
jgi:hypothetical protein